MYVQKKVENYNFFFISMGAIYCALFNAVGGELRQLWITVRLNPGNLCVPYNNKPKTFEPFCVLSAQTDTISLNRLLY